MSINKKVGIRMKDARKDAFLTQMVVADQMGVAVVTLSRWETGNRQPSFVRLEEFAKIVKRPLYEFFKDSPAWLDPTPTDARQSMLKMILNHEDRLIALEVSK